MAAPRGLTGAMVGAIVANTGVLGWSWLDHVHQQAIERMDTCFVVFFFIRRAGWRWLRRPWNLFDATIILLALLPVVGDGITILRMARVAKTSASRPARQPPEVGGVAGPLGQQATEAGGDPKPLR